MKTGIWLLAVLTVGTLGFVSGRPRFQHSGNEWQVSLPVPRCAPSQNVQVIWPEKGGPITIECDNMK